MILNARSDNAILDARLDIAARWGKPMLARDRRRKTLNSNHLLPSGLALSGKGKPQPVARVA